VSLFTRQTGAGPLVVVLHGGPGASHDYLLPQYDLLAKGRELFYYDQRGGGQSPVPREAPVGWEAHVADLEGIRVALGREQLVICGYSWGGLLGLLYTLRHPEQVERLALIAPAAITQGLRDEFEAEFSRRMNAPQRQAERDALRTSGLRERDPGAYQRRAFELSVMGYFKNPADAVRLTPFRVVARTQKAVWDSLGDWDLRSDLEALASRSPLPASRILHGTSDPMPIASSQAISRITGAELIPLDCGHCPHVEVTSGFVRALDEFLPRA
ncbi:MAG TPA: alpha/beta fold hydrolase, partial [Gemmatimonadales bacterium]|nr:alpha/beta fold hydrolase [Gemmatimonadales bacterium]